MAKSKKSKKVIIFSIAAVLLVVLTLLVVLGSKKEPVFTVQTEQVQRRTVTQTVTATGKIHPEVQVTITPEVSGEIIDLPVKEGAKVKRGDLLLKIKPDIYLAQRDRAMAELTSAKANLHRSESEVKRAKELFSKGLISSSELEQSTTSYEVARAQFNQAEANVKQVNENLAKTSIFSPMDGTVSQLRVEQGERVLGTSQFQGTTVMTVADLTRMEARVDVGENDVVLISVGDTARIEVDAIPDTKLVGLVYQIGNTAKTKGLGTQEEVTNFEVRVRILGKEPSLRPGMSMTATIETETKREVLTVPIQSVTIRTPKEDDKSKEADEEAKMAMNNNKPKSKAEKPKEVVFLVENGATKMVEVTRGISNDEYTEIVSGIEEGNEVVSGSYKAINRELEAGSKVRVDNEKKKPNNTVAS